MLQKANAVNTLISNHIFANQTLLIEELFLKGFFNFDSIENLYNEKLIYGLSKKLYTLEEEMFDLEDLLEETTDINEIKAIKRRKKVIKGEIDDILDEIKYLKENPQEIFEWWLVTDWLGQKLYEKGEPVLRNGFGTWWGRTTTGQSIEMDDVIIQIAIENIK